MAKKTTLALIATQAAPSRQLQCPEEGALQTRAKPETKWLLCSATIKSFAFSVLRNICLDDAAAVNDKEGVVGKVGSGVQHSKAARHLRF